MTHRISLGSIPEPLEPLQRKLRGKELRNAFLLNLAVVVALSAMFVGLFLAWAYTPVVYESYSTRSCVEVLSPNPEHSCENLPKRYEHVWVQ